MRRMGLKNCKDKFLAPEATVSLDLIFFRQLGQFMDLP